MLSHLPLLKAVAAPKSRLAARRALLFLLLIAVAESVSLFDIIASAFMHALLIVLMLALYLRGKGETGRLLLALVLIPLLRLLSMTMPIPALSPLYWQLLIGLPALLAIFRVAGVANFTPGQLGLQWRHRRLQLVIAISGFLLSAPAYIFLRPEPLIDSFQPGEVLLASFILLLFSGFMEELLFRGVLQQLAREVFGREGFLFAWLCYTVTLIGNSTVSPLYLPFMAMTALFFGYWVELTGSLWGAVLAHTFLNIGLFLIFPFVL
jgi:membrane protease YdiL (CAAX protease family)